MRFNINVMKKIILSLFLFLSLIGASFTSAFAQTCTPTGGKADEGIDSAIGCIPVGDTNQFMGWILGWAVGVGGGIAFLLIVYASFMVMTSQGDPARLKAGQELLTSAISGLIMLIFSVFILKFIGVDILELDNL
ncbi:MAG: hypothetical protein ACD_19C00014G0010 [uncultured bacterium]|nr:MAG: hypothetical protein ACD_19C00014G0010 [uncultured bacterium]